MGDWEIHMSVIDLTRSYTAKEREEREAGKRHGFGVMWQKIHLK